MLSYQTCSSRRGYNMAAVVHSWLQLAPVGYIDMMKIQTPLMIIIHTSPILRCRRMR